jgi:dephospho-CoA kinase
MVESTQGTQGSSAVLSTINPDPNTLIKDKKRFDDEAAPLGELFRELEREIIGKNSASLQQWQDLRELLITELKIAATRTTVSNVPAFLTEHLRRRLWKVDKKRATEIAAAGQGSRAQSAGDKEKQKCLDCAGTGFWYPDGPDKGVTRCMHLKLPPIPATEETD